MKGKVTAVYLMVRQEELTPEEAGNYEGLLARQKAECLGFLHEKTSEEGEGEVQIYTSRSQLLMDVERKRIGRLVVQSQDRLGSSKEEIDGILFELNMEGIEVLTVQA